MSLKSEITKIILKSFPETLLDRLSENEAFVTSTDLTSIRYSDLGTFDHEQVLAVLRSAHEGECAVTLVNDDGVEFELERLDEGVRVAPLGSEQTGRFVPELQFLDPVVDVRLNALEETIAACQPLLISESHWQSILAERVLSENELAQLVSDIRQSPSEFIAGLAQKWRSGNINSDDLFPKSLSYYEALVGPCPTGQNAESYINDVLVPHQKQLINRSLDIGLRYILPANIDRRMSLSELVAEQSSDALLEALTAYTHSENPFVIVGVLEIALSRHNDHERFGEVAEEIANRLVEGSLSEEGGSNYYKLAASLIHTCLGWISVEEEFWGVPPYWRRLAAFTHAHFLFDVLTSRVIDVKAFSEWLDSIRTPGMFTMDLLDMQKEPMWSSSHLSPVRLKSEITGRLVTIDEFVKAGKIEISNWPSIDAIMDELRKCGGLLLIFSPGPMEGDQRPGKAGGSKSCSIESMGGAFKKVLSDIEKNSTSHLWGNLSLASMRQHFDPALLDSVVQLVSRISMKDAGEDRSAFFDGLVSAAYIVATQSCELGAEAVVTSLLREADTFQEAHEAGSGYNIILIASAAFVDNEKSREWLALKMADYAFSTPKGSACNQLYLQLEMLQVFFPISERCFGRARKFASSALT